MLLVAFQYQLQELMSLCKHCSSNSVKIVCPWLTARRWLHLIIKVKSDHRCDFVFLQKSLVYFAVSPVAPFRKKIACTLHKIGHKVWSISFSKAVYKDKRKRLLTYYCKLVKTQWCNILAIQGFYQTHMSFDRLSKTGEYERKKMASKTKRKRMCATVEDHEKLAYGQERLTYPVLKT